MCKQTKEKQTKVAAKSPEAAAGKDGRDFFWSFSEEPHASRRVAIMKEHPEVKELFGHDPNSKLVVTSLVLIQCTVAFMFKDSSVSWKFMLAAYAIGGTINHWLFLAIHELSHNLMFKKPSHNQFFSFFANIPIGLPYSVAFKGYHMEHHKSQGVDGVDTDIPTRLEGILLSSKLGKLAFCITQIFFYAVRPMAVRRQTFTARHAMNWAFIFAVIGSSVKFFGVMPLFYFLMSSFFAGSLHPTAGHFIAEHYVFQEGHETYSYYGPLNILAFNVGYHNEHHDFPNVPGSRLPLVRALAPGFYDPLPQCKSWPMTIVNYIMSDKMSPFSRIKRTVETN